MLTLGFWSHKSHKTNLFAGLIYRMSRARPSYITSWDRIAVQADDDGEGQWKWTQAAMPLAGGGRFHNKSPDGNRSQWRTRNSARASGRVDVEMQPNVFLTQTLPECRARCGNAQSHHALDHSFRLRA